MKTTISPAWWCPACRTPGYTYDAPCKKCGRAFDPTWLCEKCGRITSEFDCLCGFDRAKAVRNRILERELSTLHKDDGPTIFRRFYTYLRYVAFQRRIPEHVAEEAWGDALERIVENIGSFDRTKGTFHNWGCSVVRNALLRAAENDAKRAEHLGPSLDYVSEDGELLAETFSIDDDSLLDRGIEAMDTASEFRVMRELAKFHLGVDLYKACVRAFEKTEGRGWIRTAAMMAGVGEYTISRRKNLAREMYQRWVEQGRET